MDKLTEVERPANKAIRLLGLIDLAHACRVTTDAVRKWPKGKGGYIPAQHQSAVLRLARSKNVPLLATDLILTDAVCPQGENTQAKPR